jgi:hypothetical protein
MSLTEAETVFAGVHEAGVNDLFKAFFTARPRFLTYATPGLVPPAAPFTSVPAIAFPGIPGGIEYRIKFEIPTVDFAPDSSSGTSPLQVGSGQLNIRTKVTITVGCYRYFDDTGKDRQGTVVPISTSLEVWARGKPTVTYFSPGNGEVGFSLDEVEIVDITPDSLESVVECILRMILLAVIRNIRLPFNTLTAGAFSLALLRGPEIEDDQVKIYGNA